MIRKIISGGQTGADQGGLEAGAELGVETGGTAPPNFITEKGPNPSYLRKFGLVEGEPDPRTFPKRTIKNVYDADGTVWFGNESSPGGRLTINENYRQEKPVIVNPSPSELREWIEENDIRILNVAGNRESKNPGIGNMTKRILMEALT